MPKDFLIADTHFGSNTIIRYENRPFQTSREMTDRVIQNWNSVVTEKDTVYVLGDFSDQQTDEQDRDILQKLAGKKILIMGNHDLHRSPQEWRDLGFYECSAWPILYKDFFLLSHEPLYMNANMPYVNIFGHVHGNQVYKDYSNHSACVCVERIQYKPLEFEKILYQLKEIEKLL